MLGFNIPEDHVDGRFVLSTFQGYEDADGNVVEIPGTRKEVADFHNLITNAGLTAQMTTNITGSAGSNFSTSGCLTYWCMVGNGTVAESVGSTALSGYLAGTTTARPGSTLTSTSAPYYNQITMVKRFAPGFLSASSNVNITEIGLGAGNNTGVLWTRALIKDSNGNPVAITITPVDYLDVTYILRHYPWQGSDITGQVNIDGVQTDFVMRPANVNQWTFGRLTESHPYEGGAGVGVGDSITGTSPGYTYPSTSVLGTITGIPTGSSISLPSSASNQAPVGLTRKGIISCTINDNNNPGGIGCMLIVTTRGSVQISFSPAIPKNNTKIMSISVTVGPISRYP